MTPNQIKRKLAAILSADVKGYSRLMGEDEEWTLRTLNAFKETMGSLLQQHRGRVVGTAGDSMLAEFASVVDAVQCAVEIQQVLRAKNAVLPETRRMEFRIGINLGDVIEEGETIYGDGVNIAARVEGLAEAGGICISGSAYEQIENKIPLHYDYLGEHEVKNIVKPVRVYRARIEPEVASTERMAFPLPDKPSIAVLAFVNMSDDPKQEFFSDGMTEEIITALSKSPYLFVIARQSTFAYKNKPVKVKQVSEELGVRYVLEGSVRRSGEKVRITAQLIDAMTGYHLWAERYDRNIQEIFALQDEIALKIMKTVHEKLEVGQQPRVLGRGARNLEAFLKAMEAREHFYRDTKEDNALARKLYEEATLLDPEYAFAYAGLASTYMLDVWVGTSKSPEESVGRAIELAERAVALDESEPVAQAILGHFYTYAGEFNRALAHAERGLALDPNSYIVLYNVAVVFTQSGLPEEAIPLFQKAMRLSPFPPAIFFARMSVAYGLVGRFDEAVEQAKKAVEQEPKNPFTYLSLAASCILAGREEEARAAATEVLKINPTFSVKQFARIIPYRDTSQIERIIEALRKAGLK
jgi:adenylate cyclase